MVKTFKIIGAIATVVMLLILFVSFIYQNSEANSHYNFKIHATKSDIEFISAALERYKKLHGNYPNNIESLTPVFLAKVPVDVWGKPYIYILNNSDYQLFTYGENGVVGGNGLSYDFSEETNWLSLIR